MGTADARSAGRAQAYTVDIRKQFSGTHLPGGDSWARNDPFVANS